MNDHELMTAHADVLFRYDDRGRMLVDNAPGGAPAPRLFVGFSPGGYVVRFGAAVPNAMVRDLQTHFERLPPCAEPLSAPEILAEARALLEPQKPVTEESGGPAYRFPDRLPAGKHTVQITEENVDVARETYPWLLTELRGWWPCFALVHQGSAVAVCFSARIGAAACEAGVHTQPEFRGQGLASTVTAAWGADIRVSGRTPLYSTGWTNAASQGVARRLGLVRFGADATLT